jgi:hypothetical protein
LIHLDFILQKIIRSNNVRPLYVKTEGSKMPSYKSGVHFILIRRLDQPARINQAILGVINKCPTALLLWKENNTNLKTFIYRVGTVQNFPLIFSHNLNAYCILEARYDF